MTPHDLVGQRVKVLAWDDLRDVLPTGPSGTVTHVADFGAGGVEVTVRVAGFDRSYVFGLDEVEVLPCPRPPAEPAATESGGS
jgi:hypothetical protein